jgi:response regulator of citrate/malate metabolism
MAEGNLPFNISRTEQQRLRQLERRMKNRRKVNRRRQAARQDMLDLLIKQQQRDDKSGNFAAR